MVGHFLEWRSSDTEEISGRLSLFSKWLVALDLLFHWQPTLSTFDALPKRRKSPLTLLHPDPGSANSVAVQFDPQLRQDNPTLGRDHLLRWIFSTLQEELDRRSHPPLKYADFILHAAELQPGALTVGVQPLRRFREWLIHRHIVPNPGLVSPCNLSDSQRASVAAVIEAVGADRGRVVVNWVRPANEVSSPELAQALARACQLDVCEPRDAFLPVRVSLRPSETRLHVLQALHTQLCKTLPEHSLPFDADIDLNDNLVCIRQILTVSRVLLIFEGWNNSSGPFASLREFLCDTEWSELIRCLAHPCHQKDASKPNLQAALRTPRMRSRIVVISTSLAAGIEPWSVQIQGAAATPLPLAERLSVATEHALTAFYGPNGGVSVGTADHSIDWYMPLALKLIVASINGIRRQTLLRLIKEWITLHGATGEWTASDSAPDALPEAVRHRIEEQHRYLDDPDKFARFIDRLLLTHSELIVETRGEQAPGLSSSMRDNGIDRKPQLHLKKVLGAEESITLQVKSLPLNSIAVKNWLDDEAQGDRESPGTRPRAIQNLASWAQTNFLLCAESLRQATAQMRYSGHSERESPRYLRRLIQCIYHGLSCSSLNIRPVLSPGFLTGGPYRPGAPLDSARRFRYLYSFIFRHCIEDDEWRLGRSFGRTDLRLDILTLFVRPTLAPLVLGGLDSVDKDLLPGMYEVEYPKLPGSDSNLRCDLLEALGRAGLDTGGTRGRYAAQWALSVLPGWKSAVRGDQKPPREQHGINLLLPMRGAVYQRYANSALKLRLDLLLSTGESEAWNEADDLCREQLSRLGIDPHALNSLSKRMRAVLEMAYRNQTGVTAALSSTLEETYGHLRKGSTEYNELVFTSDILFRIAEVRVLRADVVTLSEGENADANPLATGSTLLQFADSCALYWLADRFRADAGSAGDVGYNWPHAGARTTQYYIRVCLKLARMLRASSNGAVNTRIARFANALLDLAHDRLGLFTRHHFPYMRERAMGLLLELGHTRSWIRISTEQSYELMRNDYLSAVEMERTAKERFELTNRNLARISSERRRLPTSYSASKLEAIKREIDERQVRAERELDSARAEIFKYTSKASLAVEKYLREIEMQQATLEYAVRNFTLAEAMLLSLGFQSSQVRSLYLEQVKLVSTAAKLLVLPDDKEKFPPHLQTALSELRGRLTKALIKRFEEVGGRRAFEIGWAALDALEDLAVGDNFWEAIHGRQASNLKELATSFGIAAGGR